jgi:hypothetical protein
MVLLRVLTSTDTYTIIELRQCAAWCSTKFSGRTSVYLGLRDRAMLLMGAATAFRGDSARILLWSDLFKTSIILGDDIEAPVCASFIFARGACFIILCRFLVRWQTMQSTIKLVALTSMESCAISMPISAASAPSR